MTMLVFGCYYAWFLTGRFSSTRSIPTSAAMPASLPKLAYPVSQILDGVVFALFMLLSIGLILQLSSYNRTITAADVDVLFPTPVSPRIVMTLRVLRDYLAALLIPIIIGL